MGPVGLQPRIRRRKRVHRDLSFFGLSGIDVNQMEDNGIPTLLFVIFQMMFAIITPALITGAFVRALQVHDLPDLSRRMGHHRLRPRRALGLGPGRLALQRRRARLCRRNRRSHKRRYGGGGGLPCSSERGATPALNPTTCPTSYSGPRCSGSGGSASTPAPDSRQMAWT